MANWTALKAAIAAVIKTNGNKEITGAVLQSTLNTIVSNLGENATFKGIATPTTAPGTPDGNVFYISNGKGNYVNFSNINILEGELSIIRNTDNGWISIPLSYQRNINSALLSNVMFRNLKCDINGNTINFQFDLASIFVGATIVNTSSYDIDIPQNKILAISSTPNSYSPYTWNYSPAYFVVVGWGECNFEDCIFINNDTIYAHSRYSQLLNAYNSQLNYFVPKKVEDISNDLRFEKLNQYVEIDVKWNMGHYINMQGEYIPLSSYAYSEKMYDLNAIIKISGFWGDIVSTFTFYDKNDVLIKCMSGQSNYNGWLNIIPKDTYYYILCSEIVNATTTVQRAVAINESTKQLIGVNNAEGEEINIESDIDNCTIAHYIDGTIWINKIQIDNCLSFCKNVKIKVGDVTKEIVIYDINIRNNGSKYLFDDATELFRGYVQPFQLNNDGYYEISINKKIIGCVGINGNFKYRTNGGNGWIVNSVGDLELNRELGYSVSGYSAVKNTNSLLRGLKIGYLGDSITASKLYTNYIEKFTLSQQYNYGVGGTHIASQNSSDTSSFEYRFNLMSNDLDMVIVMGGTNDFGHSPNTVFGTFSDYTKSDIYSFYAGLHRLMKGLYNKYRGKPIIIVTPIHHGVEIDNPEYIINQDGTITEALHPITQKTFKQYVDAIIDVAAFYSFYVIDAYAESGLNPALEIGAENRYYFSDGLHPSDIGAKRFALYLKSRIELIYKSHLKI